MEFHAANLPFKEVIGQSNIPRRSVSNPVPSWDSELHFVRGSRRLAFCRGASCGHDGVVCRHWGGPGKPQSQGGWLSVAWWGARKRFIKRAGGSNRRMCYLNPGFCTPRQLRLVKRSESVQLLCQGSACVFIVFQLGLLQSITLLRNPRPRLLVTRRFAGETTRGVQQLDLAMEPSACRWPVLLINSTQIGPLRFELPKQ